MEIKVGTTVKTKVYCLSNPKGAKGVCYEVYTLGGRLGYGFIFENGEYDGFAPDEVADCLEVTGFCEGCANFEFTNVVNLSDNFRDGRFDDALKNAFV